MIILVYYKKRPIYSLKVINRTKKSALPPKLPAYNIYRPLQYAIKGITL
ncbi:hypothetical protein CNEO2_80171 [Clostridium neonatale]|nr:hypothetical protein CNEO2_60171 [Clostridium neonatale]CAI3215317.1 hypothetical protein CNEO2_80171 [Clostridium neonatale]